MRIDNLCNRRFRFWVNGVAEPYCGLLIIIVELKNWGKLLACINVS